MRMKKTLQSLVAINISDLQILIYKMSSPNCKRDKFCGHCSKYTVLGWIMMTWDYFQRFELHMDALGLRVSLDFHKNIISNVQKNNNMMILMYKAQ